MKTPKTLTIRLFIVIALAVMGVNSAYAQKKPREPFDVYIEYVQSISDYHRIFPSVDFVYGNPKQDTPGFLVVVTPHPENAAVTLSPFQLVSSSNFNVWIEAGQQDLSSGWKRFGLFWKNGQCLQYLDVNRRNTSAFALYISKDEILERVPHGDLHNITPILRFDLRIMFARRPTAKWPLEWACPIAHSATVNQWSLYFYPTEHFLTNKVEWADEGHIYMDQNPKKKFFHSRDLAWQMAGWFFNLGYSEKNYIREKINESHYVIFKLWKDPEHTKPLTFDYFKETLWPGGFSDDPDMMVKDRNTIAFPHKGFDDWTLMIPWTTIHYWWKDGIKATKENHTCFGYYTLTLSNDGKTTATNHDYDYSGWLSIDVGYEEPKPLTEKEIKRKNCKHPWFKTEKEKRHPLSEVKGKGCVADYDVFWEWKVCGVCNARYGHTEVMVPLGERCVNHDMQEVDRKVKETVTVAKETTIEKTTVYEVVYACQNECCSFKESRPFYETTVTPTPEDGGWEDGKCPPHIWRYSSVRHKTVDKKHITVVEELDMDTDTLRLKLGTADLTLIRHGNVFFSDSTVSRQLWLALNKDNNYLGLSKMDWGKLNNINYQEAYDLIAKVTDEANKVKGISLTFALPSVEEMHQLLSKGTIKPDTLGVQRIKNFYVDSIEVYDGKGRKLTKEQLATAPEGAKVRIMVGKMGADGKVEMVDVSTIDASTAFIIKAEPDDPRREHKVISTTRFYNTYKRECLRCGRKENINENLFRNMRYHRPLISD